MPAAVMSGTGCMVQPLMMPDLRAGHARIPFIVGLHHRGRQPLHPIGRRRRAAIEDVKIRIEERKIARLLDGLLRESRRCRHQGQHCCSGYCLDRGHCILHFVDAEVRWRARAPARRTGVCSHRMRASLEPASRHWMHDTDVGRVRSRATKLIFTKLTKLELVEARARERSSGVHRERKFETRDLHCANIKPSLVS